MKKTLFVLSLLSFLFIACENKYDWTNPLDSESEVNPESWAPRNLLLQKISDTQIRLTWEQDENRIEGFKIERKIDNGSWQRLVQLGANERSYTDSGLDTSKSYLYKICAFISGNQSLFSNEVLFSKPVYGSLIDVDGNVYKTVKIGNQWWMAENLMVTRYRNGESIPNVTDNSQWTSLSTDARCAYNNDNGNVGTYGLLYNWYAVNDARGLAPAGWRVPTDDDWKELEMYLGMSQSEADATGWRGWPVGDKLKATSGWSSNGNGSNESGFTALPGGYRSYTYGAVNGIGYYGHWWSATEGRSTHAWYRYLVYSSSVVLRDYYSKRDGFSVRCVRD